MNPQQITVTAATAEAICGFLETLELDHNDTAAGLLGANIRRLLGSDIEATEPPPDPDEEYPEPEPVESEIEAPEPCPDSLGDERERPRRVEFDGGFEFFLGYLAHEG